MPKIVIRTISWLAIGVILSTMVGCWGFPDPKLYKMDAFTDENYDAVLVYYGLPTELDPELAELFYDEGWQDNNVLLFFTTENREIMHSFLKDNFSCPFGPLEDGVFDENAGKVIVNGKEFSNVTSYNEKNRKGYHSYIKQYISKEDQVLYAYTIERPDVALREMIKKEGEDISKDIAKYSIR